MNCGTILYDTKFQFPDGSITDKLIIILCDFGTDFLVVQTTRQQLGKNKVAGCQLADKPPNYFIPANSAWFKDDTWVRLDEVFEYNSTQYHYKKEDGIVFYKNALPMDLMKSILECAIKSEDIDIYYIKILERFYKTLW